MDPTVCRESLATLLLQEVASFNELAVLLEREHGMLVANDVEALEKTMQSRQVVVGRLLQVEEECRGLCRAHGKTSDAAGLRQLLAWCDPRGTLTARMEECARGSGRCRELNDRNGALVVARMKRVEGLLGAITGQRREAAATYDRTGLSAATRSGRVVTTEA